MIDEISAAAYEAIEKAAGEAARAAFLVSLEREAAAYREAESWRLEVQNNLLTITELKKNGRRNTFIAALIGILGGVAIGAILMSK